jgi:hypothetical protein
MMSCCAPARSNGMMTVRIDGQIALTEANSGKGGITLW